MEIRPPNEYEPAIVLAAAEGLALARDRGIEGVDGVKAVLAALKSRQEHMRGNGLRIPDPKITPRVIELAEIVEEITQQNPTVDQQG